MANTIGQLVGIIRHTLSITNDHGDKVQITINLDCRTSSDDAIRGWIASNRVIAGQRPWRSLDASELKKLDGTTFDASAIGKKIVSKREQVLAGIRVLRANGFDAEADKLESTLNASTNDNDE